MGCNEGSDGEDWLEVARTSGKSVPMTQESVSIYAIRMYDDWVTLRHTSRMLPERTDAAAKALLDTFGDAISVGLVLGFADGEGCEEDGLEKALEAAASAIFQEHENQRKDALCFFPCTAILQAGRQMLEVWRTESAAIRHAVQVCGILEADLKEHEECADSTGLILKEKDDLVLKLQAARVLHDDKVEALETPFIPILQPKNSRHSK
jgi:hypothetical protein